MYANYRSLYNDCGLTSFTAATDRTRFYCASLPQPVDGEVRRSIEDFSLSTMNVPCSHTEKCDVSASCNYKLPVVSSPAQPKPNSTSVSALTKENFTQDTGKTSVCKLEEGDLLPVMDPTFNMREICKQSILLEDHLSQTEKRCYDCCIKHFLTIEALAEEAITLDVNQKHKHKLQDLPTRVRKLQKMWHEDPDNNSHAVSQQLRLIRKDFQMDCFTIAFQSQDCEGGVCKIKKSNTTTTQ